MMSEKARTVGLKHGSRRVHLCLWVGPAHLTFRTHSQHPSLRHPLSVSPRAIPQYIYLKLSVVIMLRMVAHTCLWLSSWLCLYTMSLELEQLQVTCSNTSETEQGPECTCAKSTHKGVKLALERRRTSAATKTWVAYTGGVHVPCIYTHARWELA